MRRLLTVSVFVLVFGFAAFAQGSLDGGKGGVVFKIPGDVFPMDWQKNGGFKGILFLRKDSPSGIFVTYPNDDETIEALKERVVKNLAPMFIHDEEEKQKISFQKSSIPKHKGDAGDSATYYLYTGMKDSVQILVYDRVSNGKSLIYGYFAMKGNDKKPESVKDIWADEKGEGIKVFEKFWKSIKE